MSLTCGLCDQQIDPDDTAFHLGKCKMAREIMMILSHDVKRDGPISKIIERIIENALSKRGRLEYLLRLTARSSRED